MAVIRLPDNVIRRIAAGEVVSHPYSVVKELVENSLDAHASSVKVKIHAGGKSRIVVEDDGDGMDKDDLNIAVLPHTTSKIKSFEDLFKLNSYGFRGEALASIGAVSKMRIETSKGEELGFAIEVNAGEVSPVVRIVKKKGTMVSVSELFFNVPARRKFLSSASVESRMVTETVQKFILSHDLAFQYFRDDEEIFNIPKGLTLLERINSVFSKEKLIEVNAIFGNVKVYGYVSAPEVGRKNRTAQAIFVNGRYVRSGLLMKAVEAGYAEHMKKGEFPVAVLFVEVPPDSVDVNVHPQKLEVRFGDSSRVFRAVSTAVRRAIAVPDVFQITHDTEEMRVEETPKVFEYNTKSVNSTNERSLSKPSFFGESHAWEFKMGDDPQNASSTVEKVKLAESKVLGILHGRYIACESKNALYLIDMHAAHERIIYDELKSLALSSSQKLAVPVKLDLNEVQRELLEEHAEGMKSLGFEWSNGELIGVPQIKKQLDWKEVFLETLEAFRLSFAQDPRDEFFATVACKAAVKSNERVSNEEIVELLKKIDALKVWACPHGRPLVYTLEFKRLDRYFGR